MSQETLELAVVGLVGPEGHKTPLLEALAASGREVVAAATTGDAAGLGALVAPVPSGADLALESLAEQAARVGTSVPVLVESETLSATEVAARLPGPERVLVVHLFDTGPGRGVVEVVPALQTDQAVVKSVVQALESLEGLTAVVVKDRPGFLLNALFLPYLNDAIAELDDELATAEDIDVALQLGLGYKKGPFQLLDEMGLGRHLATTRAVHEATGDQRYAPPALLRRMVAAGRLGTSTGAGFRATPATND